MLFSPLGSPPPAKESVTAATANSTMTSAAQLQTSDAFAAVAQLFQSSQGQQVCVVHTGFLLLLVHLVEPHNDLFSTLDL